jgi:hypothetical protein
MTNMPQIKPYAMWTSDCQGKQDFDGPILSVSTRYWPGPEGGSALCVSGGAVTKVPYAPTPSAHSSILLSLGPREEDDGGGHYLVWREANFEAHTEAEVKSKVEAWVKLQLDDIVRLILSNGGTLSKP